MSLQMAGRSHHGRMEFIALTALSESNEPAGALRLADAFRQAGIDVAEATAGRFLHQLDQAGLTQTVGTRGRILTESGLERLSVLKLRRHVEAHSAQVVEAVNSTATEDLIDMLHVQRAIESETARLAAIRATDAEIEELAVAAATHVQNIDEGKDFLDASKNFHLLVAQASHNRLLVAIAKMLLDPANDPLEKLLQRIADEAGELIPAAEDHGELVEAIRRRDPDAAEYLMRGHLDKLIALTTDFHAQGHN